MASQDWFDKDFYKVLGVSKDVSDADLKKTYRKLARTYHPDSNQGDAAAEAKFKEISEAYSVLSDAEQRKEYDKIRAMGSGARFTAGGQGAGGFEDVFSMFSQGRGGRAQSAEDFDDIFAMFNQQQGGGRFGSAGSASRQAGSAATAVRRAAPTSRRARRSTSSPPPRARPSRCRARTASRSRSRSRRASPTIRRSGCAVAVARRRTAARTATSSCRSRSGRIRSSRGTGSTFA